MVIMEPCQGSDTDSISVSRSKDIMDIKKPHRDKKLKNKKKFSFYKNNKKSISILADIINKIRK